MTVSNNTIIGEFLVKIFIPLGGSSAKAGKKKDKNVMKNPRRILEVGPGNFRQQYLKILKQFYLLSQMHQVFVLLFKNYVSKNLYEEMSTKVFCPSALLQPIAIVQEIWIKKINVTVSSRSWIIT